MTPDEAARSYADQVRWGRDYINARYGHGGVIGHIAQGDDSVPLLLPGGCDYVLTDAQLKRLAVAPRRPTRFLTPLPWRTRARLAARRAVNGIGTWLVDHGHYAAALWLWRDRRPQ